MQGMKRRSMVGCPYGWEFVAAQARNEKQSSSREVNKGPGYLMCFASPRSEIVVPIKGRNGVLGERDIDCSRLSAFNQEDRETLEGAASLLASYLDGRHFESHHPPTL